MRAFAGERAILRTLVIAAVLLLSLPLVSSSCLDPRTPLHTPPGGLAVGDPPDPAGYLLVDRVERTLTIPAGGHHHVYFDRATSTLKEMPVPDNSAGLPADALQAIARTPNWLKDNLTRKFEQLADVPIDVGAFSTPEMADVDADGDLDLLVGLNDGSVQFYLNVDGAPHYYEGMDVWVSGVFSHDLMLFGGRSVPGGFSDPAMADADLDGDLDLYVGSSTGQVYFYENVGTPSNPVFGPEQTLGISVASAASVDAVDLAGSAAPDLVVGAGDGSVSLYRNDGGGVYTLVSGYFGTASVASSANPAMADMDGDGDMDLALGSYNTGLAYFRNDGVGAWTPVASFFQGLPQPANTAPLLSDLDSDSVPDLVFGRSDGTLQYYPNYGTAAASRWLRWTNPTTSYNALNHDNYYLDDSAVFLKERKSNQALSDYAAAINQAPQEYVDELAFTIAHSSVVSLTHPSVPTSGPSGVLDNLHYNNTDSLYFSDQFIDYADIVDHNLGTPDQWSTVRYAVDNGGVVEWHEQPRYVYYWYVVQLKGSDELATFIDPTVVAAGHEGARPRGQGGYFWRYAAFNLASAAYPSGSTSGRSYPVEEAPPVLRDKIQQNALTMWNLSTYQLPKMYEADGTWARNATGAVQRPWNLTRQAVEIVSRWIGGSIPLSVGDDDDGNRPRQPVRIQWEHNGNCGEEGDLMMAGLRSALIPGRVVDGYGGDHCWAEFYERGWHQFDTYWRGDTTIVANDDNYHYGWNRDWSGIHTTRGDSRPINLVERYHHEGDDSNDQTPAYLGDPLNEGLIDRANVTVRVKDAAGNPVDGARVSVGDFRCLNGIWYSFGTIWYYTDSNGEARFATSESRQNAGPGCNPSSDTFNDGIQIQVGGKLGSDGNIGYSNRFKPSYGDAFNARNAPMNYYDFTLPGTMPRQGLQGSPGAPVALDRYRLEASFSVDMGLQHPSNAMGVDDGRAFHDYELYDGVHVDAFVASAPDATAFMGGMPFQWYQQKLDAASGTIAFDVPSFEDWYVVISNRDSLETAKVVTLTVALYDTTVPDNSVAPPTDLMANLQGPGWGDVGLTWTLSADDGGGQNDVLAYDILYATAYDAARTGYSLLDTLPPGANAYTHAGAGHGDPSDYFYAVVARDASGNQGPSLQAAKFTRWMDAGRQLASVPLRLADWGPQSVLRTLDFTDAWTYDPAQTDPWSSFCGRKVTNDLAILGREMGFWVDVRTAGYLTVAGAVEPQTTLSLGSGWNLVGYPSFSGAYTVADLAADTGAELVEAYDPAAGPYYLRELNSMTVLQAGDAYWVSVPAAVDWIVST